MKYRSMVLGPVYTNTYIVWNENSREGFIVDPADRAGRIADLIREEDIQPAAILLTHGHFDHIMAVDALRNQYGIPVIAGAGEQALLSDPRQNLSGTMASPVRLKADRTVTEGETFVLAGMTVRVIETPGHTSGSVCYYLPDEGILLSGDTLFAGSFGRYDFPTGSFETLRSSIREKLFVLPEETIVLPGHEGTTTIGEEKQWNPMAGF